MILSDAAAERAILAGICRYGAEAYYDVADIINPNTFTIVGNGVLYSCLSKIIEEDANTKIDVSSIMSKSKEIGADNLFANTDQIEHVSSILRFPVELSNVRRFGAKIRKLEISKLMYDQLDKTKDKYLNIKGDETISHILGIAEQSIFDFSSLLGETGDEPEQIFTEAEDRYQYLIDNPVDQVGISTGFKNYDFSIGGGLRRGAVSVIGARPKVGKTSLGINIGRNIAQQGVPVLYLDTEMKKSEQQDKLMASLTGIEINEIETGKFGKSSIKKKKFFKALKDSADLGYVFKNIGSVPFEDQLSIMRRWLTKEVGLDDNGKAKDCVIIYDYLKLTDTGDISNEMREFQILGFRMTALHNFAHRYDVPILLYTQLNRDGIQKESTDVAAGSDRIIWLCSNFSIFREKSEEELGADGEEYGNRKLVPVIARHGEGLGFGNYINMKMEGKICNIVEKGTKFDIKTEENEQNEEEQYAF